MGRRNKNKSIPTTGEATRGEQRERPAERKHTNKNKNRQE